ncbi:hypothetical protein HDV05_005612 [Chytridiales sp. JEL 0842]|nr:hypothetical protein HDV05_005612 [Chytridiales sp. JEL 0842]
MATPHNNSNPTARTTSGDHDSNMPVKNAMGQSNVTELKSRPVAEAIPLDLTQERQRHLKEARDRVFEAFQSWASNGFTGLDTVKGPAELVEKLYIWVKPPGATQFNSTPVTTADISEWLVTLGSIYPLIGEWISVKKCEYNKHRARPLRYLLITD